MRTNLSSQISLNRVSPKYYKPENAVERSVLTRCEKVPTDIYETMEYIFGRSGLEDKLKLWRGRMVAFVTDDETVIANELLG